MTRQAGNDLHAMVAGTTLSVISIATFLLMPQFIEAAVGDLRYSEPQVGMLSASVEIGTTVAAAASGFWIRRSSWRQVASFALAGLLAANAASLIIHDFVPFIALQGIVGFCGGSLYSLSLTILSDTRRPDRYFAYAIGAQTIYQIAGLFAGPYLIHHGGVNAILWLFLCLTGLGAPLIRYVPEHGRMPAGAPAAVGFVSRPAWLALAGCFLFYVNIGAYWTYIERIGTAAGLGLGAVSNALAFGTAASMAGVWLASSLGDRRGHMMPIAASAAVIVLSVVLLTGSLRMPAYVLSATLYGIAWNVSMTYQYSAVNAVDLSRRGVALAPAFHNAGGAVGPAIAALTVTETDHSGVLWLICASVLASLGCFLFALRLQPSADAGRLIDVAPPPTATHNPTPAPHVAADPTADRRPTPG